VGKKTQKLSYTSHNMLTKVSVETQWAAKEKFSKFFPKEIAINI
jgi:hypothetical protein